MNTGQFSASFNGLVNPIRSVFIFSIFPLNLYPLNFYPLNFHPSIFIRMIVLLRSIQQGEQGLAIRSKMLELSMWPPFAAIDQEVLCNKHISLFCHEILESGTTLYFQGRLLSSLFAGYPNLPSRLHSATGLHAPSSHCCRITECTLISFLAQTAADYRCTHWHIYAA